MTSFAFIAGLIPLVLHLAQEKNWKQDNWFSRSGNA
jgi:multidrug efflux pump subunit AcrB